ncbi:MAG TPA: hypothetical protein VF593_03655 [Chthoniobacteraceae bacterium]|jgi:type II secretory pathway component PulK
MNAIASTKLTRSGSALLLVLWALFLLSAAVFAFAKWIQQDLEIHAENNREIEARAMAHSGLALALHPDVTRLTPGLEETFSGGRGFQVRILSEGAKLNLRWILEGETPRKLTMFKQWLELRGLGFDERERLVDCLLDWTDADSDHRIAGVEDDGEYHPANRMLKSVEELEQVRGSEPLTSTEGWKEALTIHSQGPIDLISADPEILRLLPGISEAHIQRFVQFRRGKDGADGTIDDPVFKSLKEVQVFLGIGEAQFKEISGLAMVNDRTVRITSEGRSADVFRQVEVVIQKAGGRNQQPLFWKE